MSQTPSDNARVAEDVANAHMARGNEVMTRSNEVA